MDIYVPIRTGFLKYICVKKEHVIVAMTTIGERLMERGNIFY